MKLSVDLNADLGEGSGHDVELFELISSANIATGFHAGDSDTMHAAISVAKKRRVAVGAHPSLFDRENFGRKELTIPPEEVFDAVAYQLGIFQAIASALDVQPNHVKPHGALYNMAVRDAKLADAIARAVESVEIGICQPSHERALMPISWSAMERSPAVTCSPAETTASYSRASWSKEAARQNATSLLVSPAMAETITATW